MPTIHLQQCTNCRHYTLQQNACPDCGKSVQGTRPPKYSPEDPYGKYRRALILRNQ